MQSVARCTIDNWRIRNVFSIMNHHRPDIDEDKEDNVRILLQWKDEWEHVIRYRLRETIHGVESMRGIWSWHDPPVVRLMDMLIDSRMVFSSVDPVNEEVREDDENWKL